MLSLKPCAVENRHAAHDQLTDNGRETGSLANCPEKCVPALCGWESMQNGPISWEDIGHALFVSRKRPRSFHVKGKVATHGELSWVARALDKNYGIRIKAGESGFGACVRNPFSADAPAEYEMIYPHGYVLPVSFGEDPPSHS